jgi:hypothetical protein
VVQGQHEVRLSLDGSQSAAVMLDDLAGNVMACPARTIHPVWVQHKGSKQGQHKLEQYML